MDERRKRKKDLPQDHPLFVFVLVVLNSRLLFAICYLLAAAASLSRVPHVLVGQSVFGQEADRNAATCPPRCVAGSPHQPDHKTDVVYRRQVQAEDFFRLEQVAEARLKCWQAYSCSPARSAADRRRSGRCAGSAARRVNRPPLRATRVGTHSRRCRCRAARLRRCPPARPRPSDSAACPGSSGTVTSSVNTRSLVSPTLSPPIASPGKSRLRSVRALSTRNRETCRPGRSRRASGRDASLAARRRGPRRGCGPGPPSCTADPVVPGDRRQADHRHPGLPGWRWRSPA